MWYKLILTNLVLGFAFLNSYGQYPTNPTVKRPNHWLFGNKCHIEFTNDSIKQHRIPHDFNDESSASQSDSDGLLEYFIGGEHLRKGDGYTYPDPLHVGSTSTQGVIILKHPFSDSTYFITSNGIGFSILNILYQDSFVAYRQAFPMYGGEKQQATKHRNGIDLWYANHSEEGDSIYNYLLNQNGLLECPVISHTGNHYQSNAANQGQMKFSADGSLLGEVTFVDPFSVGLYHFDNEYPSISPIYLYTKGFSLTDYSRRWFYGLEFSPNNSKMYVGSGRSGDSFPPMIHQLDLEHLNQDSIRNSWVTIDSLWAPRGPWEFNLAAMQLAPNNKIYIAVPFRDYISAINDPDSFGTACNYVRDGLPLDSGGTSLYGLPNFISSDFYTPSIDFTYEEDCWQQDYTFRGLDTFGATNFQWKIRDIRNETVDVRLGKNVSYIFPQADSLENTYEVIFVASSGSVTDSVTKEITIRPKWPKDVLGRDTFYCLPFDSAQGDTTAQHRIELHLNTPPDMHCIHWGVNGKTLEPYSNLRKDTMIGYENFYGYIAANQSRVVDTAGIYTVRLTNKSFCQLWDTLTVIEDTVPQKSVISRVGNQLQSSIAAAEYRWYYDGRPKFQNTNSKFQPDSNGYWQVQLVSEYGCESELSDSFNVGFASIDDIEYRTSDLGFNVFPNPSGGRISIEVPQEGEYSIRVTDLNGKLVYSTQQNLSLIFEFDLEFASGQYILTLTDKDGRTGSQKIEVVR